VGEFVGEDFKNPKFSTKSTVFGGERGIRINAEFII
jgi:hypothetical protein